MALRIESEQLGSKTTLALRIHGDLDAHTFETLDEALVTALEEGATHLVVDLEGVPYMSSAGIGVLIGNRSEAENQGGDLALLNPSPAVLDVLQSMGFDNVFIIVKTQAEALEHLGVAVTADGGDAGGGGGKQAGAEAPPDQAAEKERKPGRRKSFDF